MSVWEGNLIDTFSGKNLEEVWWYCSWIFTQYSVKMWTELCSSGEGRHFDSCELGNELSALINTEVPIIAVFVVCGQSRRWSYVECFGSKFWREMTDCNNWLLQGEMWEDWECITQTYKMNIIWVATRSIMTSAVSVIVWELWDRLYELSTWDTAAPQLFATFRCCRITWHTA